MRSSYIPGDPGHRTIGGRLDTAAHPLTRSGHRSRNLRSEFAGLEETRAVGRQDQDHSGEGATKQVLNQLGEPRPIEGRPLPL